MLRCLRLLAVLATSLLGGSAEAAEPFFHRLDLRDVQIGGLLGQRMKLTVENNLLRLDVDRDFLRPFREKEEQEGFVGLGMLIDAAVRFAANSADPRAWSNSKNAWSTRPSRPRNPTDT